MGFSRDANFIITVDQTPFNSQFDEFNQILKDFSNSAILEDILHIPLPDDSGFRKQFELVAKLIRSNQFAHLLFPVKDNLIDWTEIVDTRELYNPYQTFIIIQFVYFISGMLVDTIEIIYEKEIYHWMLLDMNYFTISQDALSLLFRKFMETKY